jgi:hypothetical protein
MTTTRYDYDPQTWAEIEHMARKALPSGVRLKRAALEQDFAGVDCDYVVSDRCPLALRVRFDRPIYAADSDVTFRATEPAKMAAGTYAPLILFVWVNRGFAKAGKLVDVYRLHLRADPPLDVRATEANGDGTSWLAVGIEELFATGALLRHGDRDGWAASCVGGNDRTRRIIEQHGGAR